MRRQMRTKELSKEELSYFAGLLDGEGCFQIARQKPPNPREAVRYKAVLSVGMTAREAIVELAMTFGGKVEPQGGKGRRGRRVAYRWRLNCGDAVRVSRLLLPYLRVKRREAELVCRWSECGNRNGREELWRASALLKHGDSGGATIGRGRTSTTRRPTT